ncbi:hypothetical protein VF04_04320 [Nostoc linckia z7]|uniref:Uncharacterized protein n=2 Tax=Nostoc linckia TaxID=92942 RepID=A0A9Q5ZGH2_NOSLI|nr:hypothetical protein [Nostoc linckia]PHK42938.1 hypothetical protein VF12_01020 [Nostoc linckia z15]PHK48095.1 hypothetical protein VF13_01995 [Nostoc linckia z16]PHJ65015.1 hypothetical protein VF02_11805 [Nostoc linckia z1]PHJ70193.1 hypothetical protein VF05_11965 [Nostoc linckia z3]PHJ75094.1 hypothetical protein VF03_12125 [Nostoc linckia z2]
MAWANFEEMNIATGDILESQPYNASLRYFFVVVVDKESIQMLCYVPENNPGYNLFVESLMFPILQENYRVLTGEEKDKITRGILAAICYKRNLLAADVELYKNLNEVVSISSALDIQKNKRIKLIQKSQAT